MSSLSRLIEAITQRDIIARRSTARLAEYAKLKDEIANRSTLQNAIMTLNIAAVGTLGGFVLDKRTTTQFLLLLTPLSAALGLLWLDHARSIDRIGLYIRENLWPKVAEWEKSEGVNSYEQVVQQRRLSLVDRSVLTLPSFVVFIGPALISLIFSSTRPRNTVVWYLWVGDLGLFLFSFTVWIVYWSSAIRGRRRNNPSPGPKSGAL